MDAKHTPGPWQWTSNDKPIDIATFESPGFYDNAELQSVDGNYILDCREYDFISDNNRVANALLIAAAPELLDALYQMTHRFKPVTGVDETALKIALAVIAKAEGR